MCDAGVYGCGCGSDISLGCGRGCSGEILKSEETTDGSQCPGRFQVPGDGALSGYWVYLPCVEMRERGSVRCFCTEQ